MWQSLGIAYYSVEDFKKALGYHERNLNIAKQLGDRSDEGEAYDNLGITH